METFSGHVIKMTSNYNENVYNDCGFTSMCLYASMMSYLDTGAVLPLPYMQLVPLAFQVFSFDLRN